MLDRAAGSDLALSVGARRPFIDRSPFLAMDRSFTPAPNQSPARREGSESPPIHPSNEML